MDEDQLQSRLSRISTVWSLLDSAGRSADDPAQRWAALIQRYQGAVYRYLLGAVRDPDAADELFQEFALRCLRGAFRSADPSRGQFRKYLKTTLIHLISDYRGKHRKSPRTLDLDVVEPIARPTQASEADRLFVDSWRDDLLARAWASLAETERCGGPPHFSVLKFRAENQDASSTEMTARLNEQLRPARPFTETGLRKTLQRARAQFAELVIDDVAHSLGDPAPEDLAEELSELGLLPYCRSALARRFGAS